jgi:hypothetical protein
LATHSRRNSAFPLKVVPRVSLPAKVSPASVTKDGQDDPLHVPLRSQSPKGDISAALQPSAVVGGYRRALLYQ